MINLKEIPGGFAVDYNGREVLRHTLKDPCLTIGRGNGAYNMSHGSFKIKDKLLYSHKLTDWRKLDSDPGDLKLFLGNQMTLYFEDKNGRLEISLKIFDRDFNRFTLSLPAQKKEHIYGCGEQYSELDLRGKKVPIWVQEQGVGRGRDLITLLADIHSGSGGSWHTTYFAQPTFVSSGNWYCHVETGAYSEMDFRSRKKHVINVWGIPEKIVIGVEKSAVDAVSGLSSYLGRQPALPEWSYDGVWLGVQGGTDIVRSKYKEAQIAGVQIAAIWAQDWEGRRVTSFGNQLMWDWKHDESLYPGLKDFMKDINSNGIKFFGYINPFLAIGTTDDEDGPLPSDFLYNEAKEKGYCVKTQEGRDYYVKITTFPAAIVDLTNPEAFEWIKGVIKENMIQFGLHGWMADFGEYLPVDAVMHSGESAETVHNRYPVLWAKANYEAVKEAGREEDIAFFMRAGYSGTSKYAVSVWAGDQLVNWSMDDGLASVIPAGISLGFSGIGFYHSDIGGYTTVAWIKRSKELFMRWAEHAAFTQTMRTHEGNRPGSNRQFDSDSETIHHFARMSHIYTHIKKYHKHLADEYIETGLPPMRHPYIHYEDDEKLHRFKYTYLYGRDLFVAPVYKPGVKKMKVYLPHDEWVHIWTGRRFNGGWCEVETPIGRPAVFYRADSEFNGVFEGLRSV